MKNLIATLTLTGLFGSLLQAEPRDHGEGVGRDAPPRAEQPDWGSIKKRIEGAVERGDLTRDQADRTYAEIKRNMSSRRPGSPPVPRDMRPGGPARAIPLWARRRPDDGRSDALGRVLDPLIQQGKINRMDAARIYRAAGAGGAPSTDRGELGGRDGDDHDAHEHEAARNLERMGDEMHEFLEAARRELAQVREIRRHLQEVGEDRERELAERREMEERREAERREMELRREAERHEIEERLEAGRRELEERREAMERERRDQLENLERERRRDSED